MKVELSDEVTKVLSQVAEDTGENLAELIDMAIFKPGLYQAAVRISNMKRSLESKHI